VAGTASYNMFGSVVLIAFENSFHFKTHQKNIFLFLKIIFHISILKVPENIKNINFLKNK
jgi:hypothetical protein